MVVLHFHRSTFFISRKTVTWIERYSDCQKQLKKWEETSPSFQRSIPSQAIFEFLLKDEEMERICLKSTNFARLKDEHNFTMTLGKLKTFIAILLVRDTLSFQDKKCIGNEEKTDVN